LKTESHRNLETMDKKFAPNLMGSMTLSTLLTQSTKRKKEPKKEKITATASLTFSNDLTGLVINLFQSGIKPVDIVK